MFREECIWGEVCGFFSTGEVLCSLTAELFSVSLAPRHISASGTYGR